MKLRPLLAALAFVTLLAPAAHAAEYYIGDSVEKNNMEIEPNYLTGVEMSRMPSGMPKGKDIIHLEVDVHATAGEPHGFADKEWIPYLTVTYEIEKVGSRFHRKGHLYAMTAKDGPHYANNIAMAGPGKYALIYHITPPSKAGFIRHLDQATGVPDWWAPFSLAWTFDYPGRAKE
jgi:periplasmic iron binding protein